MNPERIVLGPRPEPPPVLIIVGVMASDRELANEAAAAFAKDWGGLDFEGDSMGFDDTDYYGKEMGDGLRRSFWSLAKLTPAADLAHIKLRAWEIEQRYLREGHRRVNLDPGFIDFTKVVLASFKHGPQKLYLGHGVWADTILFWDHGRFTPLRWTFPDFKAGAHSGFFTQARQQYKTKLRDLRNQA